MQQCGGFYLTCKNKKTATAVADAAKKFFVENNLVDSSWYECMTVSGVVVQVDSAIFIEWEIFDGLFEKLCNYVEAELPGAILSGASDYSGPGISVSIKAERTKSGLRVYSEDYDDSAEVGCHVCMACGGEFPEDECVYVDDCEGWFCNDCYEASF